MNESFEIKIEKEYYFIKDQLKDNMLQHNPEYRLEYKLNFIIAKIAELNVKIEEIKKLI